MKETNQTTTTTENKETKTMDGYCFRAQFKDEMKAEAWMMDNCLENGFYRRMSDGMYVVFEYQNA